LLGLGNSVGNFQVTGTVAAGLLYSPLPLAVREFMRCREKNQEIRGDLD